jgi:1-acyl-sn-glycerol-3-phosphate acyltransferase
MTAFFSIIRLLLLCVWSLFCILFAGLAYFLTFQKSTMLFLAKRLWARPALIILGARVKVSGLENISKSKHYLIMANHASYSDIPALFRILPFYLHFIAKIELKKVPLLGWYMAKSGMIFIERNNKSKSVESINAAAKLIKKGKSVVIFPEGTSGNNGEISVFKKGGFHLARASESTILPIRIKGTERVWPSHQNLKIRGGKVEIIIGKPIEFEDYASIELDELVVNVRDTIISL